jgi:hypothetical protein
MEITSEQHPPEDLLEKYAMRQLSGAKLDDVEDHLLTCGHCQEQVVELETFATTFREVAPILEREDRLADQAPSLMGRVRQWWGNPMPVLAFAGAAVAAVIVGPMVWQASQPLGEPQVIELQAVRAAAVPEAATRRPLILRVDLAGLPAAPSFRAEIATAAGETQVTRSVTFPAELTLEKGLPAGQYWLRLYGAEHAEPVREFGFTVR